MVLGFYTLSALSIDVSSLPEIQARRLPRHPLPAALLGRLAVGRSAQGEGLGRMLLADAVQRTLAASEQVAIHALVVDAKNESARRFYHDYGFFPLADQPMRLFLPLRPLTGRSGSRLRASLPGAAGCDDMLSAEGHCHRPARDARHAQHRATPGLGLTLIDPWAAG